MATIKDVRMDRPIEFVPYIVEGIHGRPIDTTSLVLSVAESCLLIDSLTDAGQLSVVEESLQGLCERNDGTKLKTALPTLEELSLALTKIDSTPLALSNSLFEWEKLGCNEVLIHFEEAI